MLSENKSPLNVKGINSEINKEEISDVIKDIVKINPSIGFDEAYAKAQEKVSIKPSS